MSQYINNWPDTNFFQQITQEIKVSSSSTVFRRKEKQLLVLSHTVIQIAFSELGNIS